MTSNALAPVQTALPAGRAGRLAPSSRLRSGAGLQTAAGSVSAFFAMVNFDRRRGVATYGLRVINRSKSALICRTWILGKLGETILAYPTLFEVEPFSTSAVEVPIWPKDFPAFERAIAEIVGDGVHCVVEAGAPPVRNERRLRLTTAAACIVAGILLLGASAALRGAVPRIAALAVAPQTLPGTTVEAQYSTAGSGSLSYLVTAPDGHRTAGGTLASHAGSIFVTIPPGTTGAYALRLDMHGPLGTASDTRIVNAVTPRANGAEISDISVHPIVAKPGEAVDVAYAAAGDGGYVRLVGTDGTIWAERPFSSGGQTRLVVPPVGDQREMHVILHVTKGDTAAQSVAGFVVANPQRESLPDGPPVLAGDDDPSSTASATVDPDANGTFAVQARSVHGGDAVAIKILSPRNGMHVALMDPQSKEVTGEDVGSDADMVTLRAPAVKVATRYTVVATFTDGFGQESIVEPVTILP